MIGRDATRNLSLYALSVILFLLFYSIRSYAVPPDPSVYGLGGETGQSVSAYSIPGMTESPSIWPAGSALTYIALPE